MCKVARRIEVEDLEGLLLASPFPERKIIGSGSSVKNNSVVPQLTRASCSASFPIGSKQNKK